MQKKNHFVTSHVITARTGGTLYQFPQTLRDVFAFKIRAFQSSALYSSYGSIIHILCPDLLSGYRAGTQQSQLLYSIAQFPTSSLPPVFLQHKHSTMIDMEVHHLSFRFVDQNGNEIMFNPLDNPCFILDLWHRNKHQD